MRNYKLEVELSFLAENEALEIMDSCASLLKDVDDKQNAELIGKFKAQVDSIVSELQNSSGVAAKSYQQISDYGNSVNEIMTRVLQLKGDCERMLGELDRQLKDFQITAFGLAGDIDNKHKETEKLGRGISQVLTDSNNSIKEIKQRIEAAKFIRDMANFNKNIITGGKVRLIGPDDLGNPQEIKKWEA